MSRPKVKRAVNKPFRLKPFPCQAHQILKEIRLLSNGSGNPRGDSFCPMAYLSDQLLSRYAAPSKEGAELRASLAVDKLLESEKRNVTTNQRLSEFDRNPPTKFVTSVINRARIIISEILGEVDYEMFLRGGFSSGSSTSRLKRQGMAASKYDGKGDVTLRAYPYIAVLQHLSPLWTESCDKAYMRSGSLTTRVVEGNVVFTVPKDSTIDRAAAKEPDYNMYLQRAVGSHVRRKLRLHGIDLNDQTVNQELARIGSTTGSLATLDLSAASDSVTTGLVQLLFPQQWTDLLFDLRSERGVLPGSNRNEFHVWEMLSSMGNGYTFEVESLIFYSLCRAVAYVRGIRGTISVYGDDLIVPTQAVSGVRRILRYAGFRLNVDKSFYNTPFRESCGKHFYNGADVTPFYIREPVVNQIRLIHVLNHLRDWGAIGGISDPRLYPIWEKYANRIPKALWGSNIDSIFALKSPIVEGCKTLKFAPVRKEQKHHSKFSHYIASLDTSVRPETDNWLAKRFESNQLSETTSVDSSYRLVPNRHCMFNSINHFCEEVPNTVVTNK
nr:MAG: RNA dependent RNA polymerase [Leviviridae sp.]